MKRRAKLLAVSMVLGLFSFPSYALDGTEVMKKVLNIIYYQGNDQRANAYMRIVDKQGRERIRDLILLRLNVIKIKGNQKYYEYFKKPSDIKKKVFNII